MKRDRERGKAGGGLEDQKRKEEERKERDLVSVFFFNGVKRDEVLFF